MGHSLGAACAAAEVIANPEVQQVQLLYAHPDVEWVSVQGSLQDLTQQKPIVCCCPQGVDALVLVAPAIVAMSLGWHERKEEAHAEAAARASGDEVAVAKAAASTAEFQSNTASRIMCAFYLLQSRSHKELRT
jgi:pyrimidine deaminase RibD-like protein